ncbi:hypothetical protein Tco_0452977 [Tanacetum coccineum]
MSDSEDSTVTSTISRLPVTSALRSQSTAPSSPILIPFCSGACLPELLTSSVRYSRLRTQPMPAAELTPTISHQEEVEHLAPADPAAVAYSADQDPYLAYRVTARMSIRPQAPAPYPPPPLLIITTTNGPYYVKGSLGSRAARIRQRDALPSPVHETEIPEICLPLRKRLCRTTPGPGYEAGLYGFADMLDAAPRCQMSRELGYGITDTWDDLVGAIQEIAPTTLEGVNQRVTEDRPFHKRTALLMEEEARVSRAAWAQSMDACDQCPTFRPLIDEGVTAVLAARATTRNGDDSHTSGTGVRRTNMGTRCSRSALSRLHEIVNSLFFRGTEEWMFPEETDKIERYVGGMPDLIYSSVIGIESRKTFAGGY